MLPILPFKIISASGDRIFDTPARRGNNPHLVLVVTVSEAEFLEESLSNRAFSRHYSSNFATLVKKYQISIT